jgi:Repeat of unknown function (DUF5648)
MTVMAAATLLALLPTAIAPAEDPGPKQNALQVSYYQFYNPTTAKHYYSRSIDDAFARWNGYQFERLVGSVIDGPDSGYVPFHLARHSVSGDNFYSTDFAEIQFAVQNNGFVYIGVSAYVAPPGEDFPLYRMYNPSSGDHFYTPFWGEVLSAQNIGYVYERVAAGLPCVWTGSELNC